MSIASVHPDLRKFGSLLSQRNSSVLDGTCLICLENFVHQSPYDEGGSKAAVLRLECDHLIHHNCALMLLGRNDFLQCPTCNNVTGIRTGNQPIGARMQILLRKESIYGFSCPTIYIYYSFPNSTFVQDDTHPEPGHQFSADNFPRVAYLPYNHEGKEICNLFRIAFERRLIFTVGTSATTGRKSVVTWTGIHHKTSMYPGPFGYPDPAYFDNVKGELAAVGVTPADICTKEVSCVDCGRTKEKKNTMPKKLPNPFLKKTEKPSAPEYSSGGVGVPKLAKETTIPAVSDAYGYGAGMRHPAPHMAYNQPYNNAYAQAYYQNYYRMPAPGAAGAGAAAVGGRGSGGHYQQHGRTMWKRIPKKREKKPNIAQVFFFEIENTLEPRDADVMTKREKRRAKREMSKAAVNSLPQNLIRNTLRKEHAYSSDEESDDSSASSSYSSSSVSDDDEAASSTSEEEKAARKTATVEMLSAKKKQQNAVGPAPVVNKSTRSKSSSSSSSSSSSDSDDESSSSDSDDESRRPFFSGIKRGKRKLNAAAREREMKRSRTGEEEDEDLCSAKELSALFNTPFHAARSTNVGGAKEDLYVLHADANSDDPDALIAAGISNHCVNIYHAERLALIAKLKGHQDSIAGVKFANTKPQVLFTGGREGAVRLWDLRTKPYSCVHTYFASEMKRNPSRFKHATTFDVDCQDRIVCLGTEQLMGDTYLLFWDIRACKLLGGYWYSHGDDITHVQFHPNEGDTLATTSVDGLINIFDLERSAEEEALTYVLNTGCSVRRLRWFGGDSAWSTLAALTHNEDVELWERSGVAPFARFSRDDICSAMQRLSVDHTYVADVHKAYDAAELIVVAGSKSAKTCVKDGELRPYAVLPHNKGECQIIRCTHYFAQSEILLTGGEKGAVTLWAPGESRQTVTLDDDDEDDDERAIEKHLSLISLILNGIIPILAANLTGGRMIV
ncbi:unnamed protein product [Notodromas monacha]|uniref:WD repeat-containing protein 89 n=1 Tax=Notodromas monacha TaxID=399045 RepID=A0A7R9GE18_9CRUS|nr:unnamed protein product [Notodromas monacha]CAG0917569.1 unnamed protein product [Notodromas monacha]